MTSGHSDSLKPKVFLGYAYSVHDVNLSSAQYTRTVWSQNFLICNMHLVCLFVLH